MSCPSSNNDSNSSSSPDSDWAWLPQNLIFMVLNKLLLLSDMLSLSSVCTNWRSVARDRFRQLNLLPNMNFNRNVPMLLIPSTEGNKFIRSLYNINRSEIYDLHLQVPYNKRCCGSSHGWLIILDDDSFEVILINPFYFGGSKGIIHLPKFSPAIDMYNEEVGESFNSEFIICKAILSGDPILYPNDYIVMVIYGEMRMLAYWKSGATDWTYITWYLPPFFDVIYVNEQFLAVNSLGQVYSCEIDDEAFPPYTMRTTSIPIFGLLGNYCRRYIVELPDQTILQAIRMQKTCATPFLHVPILTAGFFIYKMVVDANGRSDWLLVNSLGDGALFLGDNYSHYVLASQFPGCESNSIYYTDDYHDSDAVILNPYHFAGPFDIGVFRVEEGTTHQFYLPLSDQYHLPPPIWILPTI